MQKLLTLLLAACCCFSADAKRIYVNINATGANNGTSWANAYTELSIPLDNNANVGDTFWVANGIYTSHTLEPWSFHVMGSTALYGGFDGSETALSQRKWSNFLTVLAGANGYHSVVYSDSTGRVDGFKITHSSHAAIQNLSYGFSLGSGFTIANCHIANLWSISGVSISGQNATINNCLFTDNGPSPIVTAPGKGSSIRLLAGARANITDCTFKNNKADMGGAIYQSNNSQAIINRCMFSGNSATSAGGALYDDGAAKLRIFNSVLVGNKAPTGGAHYAKDSLNSTHNFTHCTIANNWSSAPGSPNYALWLRGPKDTLRNCILWGDSTGTGPEIANPKPGAVFSRNVIENGSAIFGATGTFTFNPMFVSPGNVASAPFALASAYNYQLSPFSDAIDTALNLGLVAPFHLDLDSNARAQGRFPDLGAYEWKSCAWHGVSISAAGPTTFCLPGSVVLTALGNPVYNHAYQWNGGTHTGAAITVNTTGVNKVVVVDSLGCRASASVMVNAVPVPNPIITRSGSMLSVPATYATYQWYLAGNLISGATSATYTATSNGNYTVKVTTVIGGCTGTSAAYALVNLAVGRTTLANGVRIYPNPGDGRFVVAAEGQLPAGEIAITIRNVTGQEVFRQVYRHTTGSFSQAIDISGGARGIYFVELQTGGERLLRKIILE